jgi:trans-aconitate methyltransferase
MCAFSREWLALREPADAEARSSRLTRLVAEVLAHDPVHALDLGTGTGANVRYLTSRLPVRPECCLWTRTRS